MKSFSSETFYAIFIEVEAEVIVTVAVLAGDVLSTTI
jgi:hypothetical protein